MLKPLYWRRAGPSVAPTKRRTAYTPQHSRSAVALILPPGDRICHSNVTRRWTSRFAYEEIINGLKCLCLGGLGDL